MTKGATMDKDRLVLVAGAGGFIGGLEKTYARMTATGPRRRLA